MSMLLNLTKVDGDDQLAASQISKTPLDQAHEESILLVEWALTRMGKSEPTEV